MTGANTAIELPEQIGLDAKTAHGQIRQLRRGPGQTDSPLVNFTIGKASGQLYTRQSGERVLLVEDRITPPEKIDEVLWMRTDHPPQWLKPLPVSQLASIPNRASIAEAVRNSWRGQFFYVEEEQKESLVVPGLRPPQIGASMRPLRTGR